MSHATVIPLFSGFYLWLLLVWLLQSVAGVCRVRTRGWVPLLTLGLVSAGILLVRVDGLCLARWAVSFSANFSIPFLGLVAAAVWERSFSQAQLSAREWRSAWAFGLVSGLLLYPLALGVGKFDPYTWGWRFTPLFVAGAILTSILILKRNRFGLLLLLSIIAYRLRLLESTNYWDYVVDPFYCLALIPALGLALVPRKMNLQFQRKADAWLGPPICAMLSFLGQFRRKPTPHQPVRRILVILLSEMGSLVLSHAMFARLKERYPGASIHILLFGRHREVVDLMELAPKENVLTLEDRSLVKFATDALKLLFTFRSLRFDVVIDCELFARISSILSFLSGARVRVGFHPHTQEGLYRGSFINRPVVYNPYRHISQQFLTLANSIESDTVPVGKDAPAQIPDPPPWLKFPPEELSRIALELSADFPSTQGKTLVLVYPSGGALPIRAWPVAHYFELCTALLRDGCAVGIIGLAADKALGQEIVAHCQDARCIDLTGYTRSIRHLLGLFHRAALVITTDGGPGQFAVLTPVPTIILFGPETPLLYRPLGKASHCFHVQLSCSPCLTAYNHRSSPCDGDNQCLKQISPAQVLAKARELLGPVQSPGGNAALPGQAQPTAFQPPR